MRYTKVRFERNICNNCQKCLFLMIQKDKFKIIKILHNICF
jgi:hypothetical protein